MSRGPRGPTPDEDTSCHPDADPLELFLLRLRSGQSIMKTRGNTIKILLLLSQKPLHSWVPSCPSHAVYLTSQRPQGGRPHSRPARGSRSRPRAEWPRPGRPCPLRPGGLAVCPCCHRAGRPRLQSRPSSSGSRTLKFPTPCACGSHLRGNVLHLLGPAARRPLPFPQPVVSHSPGCSAPASRPPRRPEGVTSPPAQRRCARGWDSTPVPGLSKV